MASSEALRRRLFEGLVIPAHPLALTAERKLDERRQRALTRYYRDAGAGGIAVAVHTTQFEIREHGLLQPVLELAAQESGNLLRIAGVVGPTVQAVREARLAADLGYDAVLLSLAALSHATNRKLIEHCREVAQILPVVGFYLQPAVGGRVLPFTFWRQFAEIDNVVAIKVAPFNRYQTLDVVRAVAESGRAREIALYTGNDDNIVLDLLNPAFSGGLLGHWAVWTHNVVELIKRLDQLSLCEALSLNAQVTDANAAFFDAANGFQGCIAGINEVLRRAGLLQGRWCLNPNEDLSPGQSEEIDRVFAAYPHLSDFGFVSSNLDRWLS
ncbi:MAG TPA: dihydrodipicolinate synthase family protein [Bryobacteraceae bacterium]|jgi:dihydrodipicolinate synthase/N-acetylneuraminate lyase|nr:dihydrodipicolinate synthase family protein [Bryobacteraceae bacterium]